MLMIKVIRNNQQYGPYSEAVLLNYVNTGQILLEDKAISDTDVQVRTVNYYLKQANLKPHRQNGGAIFNQLRKIGSELIFPKTALFSKQFIYDRRFLILALVGLMPMVFMYVPFGGFLLFYEISIYFSIIWGLFFYVCFKTFQVRLKTTLAIFFLTQAFVFTIWDIMGLPAFNPFYALLDTALPTRLLGYIFGVGFCEEVVKMLPLLIVLRRAKEPMIPQTVVYYGLISGIAFGVWEGVQYQMTVNAELQYDASFFMNIVRLTSLPFLHACWCGIAGYFLAFAHLYPKYRRGLYFLSIVIPMTIHGLYDTFSDWIFLPLIIVFFGLLLLTIYLKQGINYQSKLRQ